MKYCKQGHEQVPENQYKVNDRQRGVRYRCKPCAKASRKVKGEGTNYDTMVAAQAERHLNRVEDIEFLLDNEVNGPELLARSGYTRIPHLIRALESAGRGDLARRVRNT